MLHLIFFFSLHALHNNKCLMEFSFICFDQPMNQFMHIRNIPPLLLFRKHTGLPRLELCLEYSRKMRQNFFPRPNGFANFPCSLNCFKINCRRQINFYVEYTNNRSRISNTKSNPNAETNNVNDSSKFNMAVYRSDITQTST